MRERGLKHRRRYWRRKCNWSLPMRERGLKHIYSPCFGKYHAVAPHAGAWIETNSGGSVSRPELSLPMRERGLKLPNA